MKNLKNTFAAFTMITVLALGTTFANAGILIGDFGGRGETKDSKKDVPTACKEETKSDLMGILISDLTGLILNLTGILISDAKGDGGVVNCGILIGD
ncbi:MAG: hypothetical protein ACRD6X_00520 [Pyrinomonadaceae bacterium]